MRLSLYFSVAPVTKSTGVLTSSLHTALLSVPVSLYLLCMEVLSLSPSIPPPPPSPLRDREGRGAGAGAGDYSSSPDSVLSREGPNEAVVIIALPL